MRRSALEEEIKHADQPACGLSPRLVVRRGVQMLQEHEQLERQRSDESDGAMPGTTPLGGAPLLARVDTVLGFERAVRRADPDGLIEHKAEHGPQHGVEQHDTPALAPARAPPSPPLLSLPSPSRHQLHADCNPTQAR